MRTRNYMDGYCHVLAAAIQSATGWPIYLIEDHVVVQVPDGRYLDWMGLRSAEELTAAWGTEPERIGHIDRLGWLGSTPDICDYEAAEQVLESAGLLTEEIRKWIAFEVETIRIRGEI